MLHALLLVAAVSAASADTTHLVLVATTDVHGHVTDWDYVANRPFPGGLVRAATVIDSLRTRYPGQVVVVDAGDLIEGDPFASYYARTAPRDPHPAVEALNLLGYDVATPGDHDLDYGLGAFHAALAAATFRYVSGNLRELPADTLTLAPFAVVQRNGIRIAIAGFTTPALNLSGGTAIRGRLRAARLVESAARVLPEARRNGDLVVVLAHSGLGGPSAYDTAGVGAENEAAALARLASRPDLVILGHSHREMVHSVINGVHFVQPAPFALGLAVLHLDVVRSAGVTRLVRVRAEAVPLATVAPSRVIAEREAPLKAEVMGWLDQSIGESRGEMLGTLARAEATPIMNFIHAVQLRRTGADLSSAAAFNPHGDLPSGDVRRRDLYGIYPDENTLRVVRITGAQLKEYLEQSARYFTTDSLGRVALDPWIPGSNYDMVGGAHYDIDLRLPPGSRVRNLRVRGRPVEPGDSYTLALSSYRQAGGGGFTALAGAPVVYDRKENIRDLLLEAAAAGRADPAELADTNWRIVPAEAAAEVRALFGVAGQLASDAPAAPADRIELRLVVLGPFDGALRPHATAPGSSRAAGGAAALATAMRRADEECNCPTLHLSTGGALAGSPEADLVAGRSSVEALNRLGIAATALGTSDASWSLDTLRLRIAQSRFPWLAANIVDSASGGRPDWLPPYQVLEASGARVAVVGYLTSTAQPALAAAGFGRLTVRAGAAALRPALAAAKAERPDLVVVLAHAAAACAEARCQAEAERLATELQEDGVDLVVAGQGDAGVTRRIGRIWLVQARSAGAELGIVDVVRTPVGARELRLRRQPVDAEATPADAEMAALVERYRAAADSVAAQPLGRVKLPLRHGNGGDAPLGTLLADAVRNATRADVALADGESLAADLPAGVVTYGAVTAALPRPSPLLRGSMTGAALRTLLEQSLGESGPTLQLAGLTARIDRTARAGKRIRELRFIDGRPFRADASYTLALPQSLAESGRLPALAQVRLLPAGLRDREALAAYLRRLPQPILPPEPPRFEENRR